MLLGVGRGGGEGPFDVVEVGRGCGTGLGEHALGPAPQGSDPSAELLGSLAHTGVGIAAGPGLRSTQIGRCLEQGVDLLRMTTRQLIHRPRWDGGLPSSLERRRLVAITIRPQRLHPALTLGDELVPRQGVETVDLGPQERRVHQLAADSSADARASASSSFDIDDRPEMSRS